MKQKRTLLISLVAGAGAVALSLGSAAAANAHVTVSSDTAEEGSYSVLTFSVPHGCDGSSTTSIAIQIPEEITSVTPTRNALYSVDTVIEALETPITDGHGNEITERVAQVIYTTTNPLPDGQRDAFELSAKLPDEAAGSTIYFPTVQTCESGESAWVQIAAEGQDPHDLDLPSPALAIIAASDDHGGHGDHEHGSDHSTSPETEASTESDSASASPLVFTSLALGALGLLTAIVALARGRNKA